MGITHANLMFACFPSAEVVKLFLQLLWEFFQTLLHILFGVWKIMKQVYCSENSPLAIKISALDSTALSKLTNVSATAVYVQPLAKVSSMVFCRSSLLSQQNGVEPTYPVW